MGDFLGLLALVGLRKSVSWISPQEGVFKFNLNRAAREKPGLAGIGGVLRNSKEAVLMLFSKQVSIKQSNEVDVMAILEALRLYAMFFVVTS